MFKIPHSFCFGHYLRVLLLWCGLLLPALAGADCRSIPEVLENSLPPGALEVIAKIERGDSDFPFPGKDGSTFGNREGCLPQGGRYREYTVLDEKMKKAMEQGRRPNRGALRIIYDTRNKFFYYTPDHYNTFTIVKIERLEEKP